MPGDKTTPSRCPICGSNNRKREQKLIDALFELAVRVQSRDINLPQLDRDGAARYIADQLRGMGFDTQAVGMSWGVLK